MDFIYISCIAIARCVRVNISLRVAFMARLSLVSCVKKIFMAFSLTLKKAKIAALKSCKIFLESKKLKNTLKKTIIAKTLKSRTKMFVDSVEISIASGDGGAGAVSFRKEKFVIQGGPDGGDGGRGGDLYFIADKNTSTLANFRGNKKYHAKNGAQGEKKNKTGKGGED